MEQREEGRLGGCSGAAQGGGRARLDRARFAHRRRYRGLGRLSHFQHLLLLAPPMLCAAATTATTATTAAAAAAAAAVATAAAAAPRRAWPRAAAHTRRRDSLHGRSARRAGLGAWCALGCGCASAGIGAHHGACARAR